MPVPSPSRPVIPRRLHKDAAFDHLAAAVLDGTLRPGERLRETDCETWLGVSRTPIRLAVSKLEHVQLVESQGGRAISVVVPRRGAALDLVATGCGLLATALGSTCTGPGEGRRPEVARRLRAVGDARPTGSTAPGVPADTGVDAVVDGWAAVWAAVAESPGGDLVARHARRLTLPLRHHAKALSAADASAVASLLAASGRDLERAGPADAASGLVRSVVRLGGPARRAPGDVARHTAPASRVARSSGGAAPEATEHGRLRASPRRRLSDDVHDLVLAAVLDGTLEPDERLADGELGAWLGVSRTPIRHALERLDESGLLDLAANRHTRIARPRPDDVVAARDLHAGLLSWSAALASHARDAEGDATAPAAAAAEATAAVEAAVDRVAAIAERAEGRPLVLTSMSCLSATVRRVASVDLSPSMSHELDVLEPRLAHGVVSCGFGLPPGAWRSFSGSVRQASRGRGESLGDALATLVSSLGPQPG